MQIKSAYKSPMPVRRDEFLHSFNYPKASYGDFVINQIGYIRIRVWLLSVASIAAAFIGGRVCHYTDAFNTLWVISSIMPFIALVTVIELMRSTSCHMAELEMSCRYSLTDVILARLGILAGLNLMVFITMLLLLRGRIEYSLWRTGIYMLFPFILTCSLSLAVINFIKAREGFYICSGISCFVSMINSIVVYSVPIVLADRYMVVWCILFLSLMIFLVLQIFKLIKKTEELQWSLVLTA